MTINISDVVVTFGQPLQINWIKDAMVPFTSVFLGAVLAHNFNINRDRSKKIDELCAKMTVVCNKSDFLLGNLMSYNEFLIEKIEAKFNDNAMDAAMNPVFIPDVSCFNVTSENYSFLASYNPKFLYLIEQLNRQLQLLLTCAETYKRTIINNSIKMDQQVFNEDDIQSTIGCLKTLRDSLEPAIEFAYVLNCQLNKCCSMYFNFLYLEDFQEINLIKETYKKYMSGIDEIKSVKDLNDIFENFWVFPLNFPSRIALTWRKFKFKCRFLYSFFMLDRIFVDRKYKNK